MRLKPDVDFKNPVCVAYEYRNADACGMQTFAGTYTGLGLRERVVGFRLSYEMETFGSIEECELTAAARGLPFLHLVGDCAWIGEEPTVLEFIRKHNPEAVEET